LAGRIEAGLRQLKEYVREMSLADSSYHGLGEKEDARLREIEKALLENRKVSEEVAKQMLNDILAIMAKHGLLKK
jgi:hypothetical protein